MSVSEPGKRFLYLWTKRIVLEDGNIVTRVCFGITSNVKKRESEYSGANGHIVKFCDVWEGISCPIETLEEQIKTVFSDHLVVGSKNARYEWLMEDITLEQIKGWINYEIQEHPSIKYFTEKV
jgi:hypothetical protein